MLVFLCFFMLISSPPKMHGSAVNRRLNTITSHSFSCMWVFPWVIQVKIDLYHVMRQRHLPNAHFGANVFIILIIFLWENIRVHKQKHEFSFLSDCYARSSNACCAQRRQIG